MRLKIADSRDFERLSPLFLCEAERLSSTSPDIYRVLPFDRALFEAICDHRSSDVLIAEDDEGNAVGKLIVWATEAPRYPNIKPRKVAYVTDLSAREGTDREAVMSFLLDSVDTWAGKHGCEVIELDLSLKDTERLDFLHGVGYSDFFVGVRRDVVSPIEEQPPRKFENLEAFLNKDETNEYFTSDMIDE